MSINKLEQLPENCVTLCHGLILLLSSGLSAKPLYHKMRFQGYFQFLKRTAVMRYCLGKKGVAMKSYLQDVISGLETKNAERIKKAKDIASLVEQKIQFSRIEIEQLAEKERKELLNRPKYKIIEEFVDFEEIVILALSRKLAELDH
jgi:hypothetical protein